MIGMDDLLELEGIISDLGYVNLDGRSVIRITLREGEDAYCLFDTSFYPYFYLVPSNRNIEGKMLEEIKIIDKDGETAARSAKPVEVFLKGNTAMAYKIEVNNAKDIPKLSSYMKEFGEVFEYDVVFWKRYLIDRNISPMSGAKVKAHKEGDMLVIDSIAGADISGFVPNYICFDIETYNPRVVPKPELDPVIMISYTNGKESGVLTTKRIDRPFVSTFSSEKEMIEAFSDIVKRSNADIIAGYNSSNFDLPYLIKRAEKNGIMLDITRYGEDPKPEHHGLLETVKIPGRANFDVYNVTRFVSVVGASEKLLKVNRFTLGEVYKSIVGDTKVTVDKPNIWQMWDGDKSQLEELADYSLSDSLSLEKLYQFFLPLEVEIAKVAGTTLAEAAISTTGQLVEYLLMRYAKGNNELIPDKPSEDEISFRTANPFEGAYVKTPDAGIYDNIAVFDFRGLYPSIIIAHNIDPATICIDCSDYFESPDGTRFRKSPQGIIPKALKMLVAERAAVKKAYKRNPDSKELAARSQALKILANSFYGYLGYARSRWYHRECASSVTALGRFYINKAMSMAEEQGFRVLYGDTDSLFILLGNKTKDDAMKFLDSVNKSLPESMELELEDFYVRGVFVGKKGGEDSKGAKKKYALLSESGRIKIKGFELVRRDWSFIARDAQKKVLEAVLHEGSKEKAVSIVKEVIGSLRSGKVPLKDLVIYTQLRKKLDSYDAKSPELAAAKKAVNEGLKTREQVEGSTIGYIITKNGSSISDKAVLEDFAKDYDPDYYIKNQVLPATLKILKELGFTGEELSQGGSQKRL
ncbi:MAG: DNA-directed DNA polymerase [Candidatus Micrarchaeaceae archaeon]